jgi:7-cyano-7-deazaguanine synthase
MSDAAAGENTAIVLLSGGMDSCTAAAEALAAGRTLALLHVTYGQRTAARERRSFDEIARHYGVPESRRLVADLAHLGRIGGSALTDARIPVPGASFAKDEVPVTYVPFRNAHFLSLAVSWAEVLPAREIWIGAVEEDSSGYPDCRAVFYEAFDRVIALGTRPGSGIRTVTPLIRMSKGEIVRRALELGAPLRHTWSCYGESERACGECESCLLRLRGFAEAGATDPIAYRTVPAEKSR